MRSHSSCQGLLVAALRVCICAPSRYALQVNFEFGKRSFQLLESVGANVEFQTYLGMAHSVSTGGGWRWGTLGSGLVGDVAVCLAPRVLHPV